MADRALDRPHQAQNDLLWAKDTLASGRFAQACFACQQVAQKAVKAVALHRGYVQVRSHSILEIARELRINQDGETMA